MPDEHMPVSLTFSYEYNACLCESPGVNARAYLSDGENEVYLEASHIFGDPLLPLLGAVVRLFYYSGESVCEWYAEPGHYFWIFERDGDLLHLRIPGLWSYSQEQGNARYDFLTTSDFWQFVGKLRLYVSRFISDENICKDDRDRVRNSREYQDLCRFIEEHKRQKAQAKVPHKA